MQADKQKQSTKPESLNQTMPVKKEDLSILGLKEEKLISETTKNNTIEIDSIKEQKPLAPAPIPSNAPRDIMNKTVNIQKEKMNYSLIDQKAIPAMKSRGPHAAFDQSMNKSRL